VFAAEQYDVPRVHLAAEVVNPRPAGEAERVYVDVARRQTGHDRRHFAHPFFRLRGSEVLNAIPWFEAQMAAERTIAALVSECRAPSFAGGATSQHGHGQAAAVVVIARAALR